MCAKAVAAVSFGQQFFQRHLCAVAVAPRGRRTRKRMLMRAREEPAPQCALAVPSEFVPILVRCEIVCDSSDGADNQLALMIPVDTSSRACDHLRAIVHSNPALAITDRKKSPCNTTSARRPSVESNCLRSTALRTAVRVLSSDISSANPPADSKTAPRPF